MHKISTYGYKNPAFIIKCGVPLQLVLYCPLGNDARKESSILSVHLATTPRFYGELTIPKSPDYAPEVFSYFGSLIGSVPAGRRAALGAPFEDANRGILQ